VIIKNVNAVYIYANKKYASSYKLNIGNINTSNKINLPLLDK
jgi:hypothetical protein